MALANWQAMVGDSLSNNRCAPGAVNQEAARLAEAIGFPDEAWATDEPFPDFSVLAPTRLNRVGPRRGYALRAPLLWPLGDRARAGGRARAARHAA